MSTNRYIDGSEVTAVENDAVTSIPDLDVQRKLRLCIGTDGCVSEDMRKKLNLREGTVQEIRDRLETGNGLFRGKLIHVLDESLQESNGRKKSHEDPRDVEARNAWFRMRGENPDVYLPS